MKRALISDIHSNLEALEAVLADIRAQGITEIYCLGDIVGYGPNPLECIDLVRQCQICLLGDHDHAALFEPKGFGLYSEQAILWTRDKLNNGPGSPADKSRRWDFLGQLLRSHRERGFLFVHGSAYNPVHEYVFPEDIYNGKKMEKIFSLIEHYCFQGHTHVPGVFTESLNFYSPEELKYEYRLGASKTMTNVGSVGQPRDGDSRACYVVLEQPDDPTLPTGAAEAAQDIGAGEGSVIRFRRVEYDFEKTIRKIYDIYDLGNFSGERLREGR